MDEASVAALLLVSPSCGTQYVCPVRLHIGWGLLVVNMLSSYPVKSRPLLPIRAALFFRSLCLRQGTVLGLLSPSQSVSTPASGASGHRSTRSAEKCLGIFTASCLGPRPLRLWAQCVLPGQPRRSSFAAPWSAGRVTCTHSGAGPALRPWGGDSGRAVGAARQWAPAVAAGTSSAKRALPSLISSCRQITN